MYPVLSGDLPAADASAQSGRLCCLRAVGRDHVAGTFSKASAALPKGGTAMFALLALGGDIGCSGGPTLVGMVSGALGDDLKMGVLAGILFPVLLLAGVILCGKTKKEIIKNS